MKARTRKHFFIFILLFVFISCSGEDEKLSIKYVEHQQQDGDCENDQYQNCVKIKFRYPEISFKANPASEKKLNSEILEQMMQPIFKPAESKTIEGMMDDFINDYNNFIKETGATQGWEVSRDIEVNYFNEGFISLTYAEYSFLGGAHSNNFVLFSNYLLNSANPIKLSDIFVGNYHPELTKIAEDEFRKLKNLDSAKTLNEAGYWFEDNSFALNNNFAINDSSLIFYYNNYEITAYAFGPTKLEIPFSKLRHLILKNGILAGLVR